MARALISLLLLTLCSCDPFVYEVDVPRFCAVETAVPFTGDGAQAQAAYLLEMGLKARLAEPGQFGEVELLSVHIDAPRDMSAVQQAQLTVDPSPQAGSTVNSIRLDAAAPLAVSGSSLDIGGQRADLYGAFRDGPPTLRIRLEGSAGGSFTADVTTCVHVRLARRYLER